MRHPYGETVTRVRATAVLDPYSQEQTDLDWGVVSSLQISGVAVEPRPSTEPTQDARNSTVSGFTLYMEPGVDVLAGDRVTVRGVLYDVDGVPALWVNPFSGAVPGVVIQTKRVEG